MNIKRIILSLAMIALVGGVVATSTGAFFSDTETSTGNTFTAGAIDLQIDNDSYYNLDDEGNMIPNSETTWDLADLNDGEGPGPNGAYLFFNFNDLKPGDIGEDTISFHVTDNPAWLCADVVITQNDENGTTEPEEEEGDPQDDPEDLFDGELADNLQFIFWADDGDNVLEEGEQIVAEGLASDVLTDDPYRTYSLADSQTNIWEEDTEPIDGSTTYYLGKAWCFGDLDEERVDQDDENTSGPDERGPGVVCDGSGASNDTQTDQLRGDIRFRAEQSRNNDDFVCQPLDDDFGQPGDGERQPVGSEMVADSFAYQAPDLEDCTVVVDDDGGEDYTTIQDAIDNINNDVPDGSTVCVADGTYDEFDIDRPLTIVGLTDPNSSADVTPTGSGVTELALITSSDVTIKGLHFDGTGTSFDGNQLAGVQISPSDGNVNNVHITHNVIENLNTTVNSAKGIQWWTDAGSGFSLTNSSFTHNVIDNISTAEDQSGGYGIQTVGDMDNVAIEYNTISNINGNWGAGIALDSKDTVDTTNVVVTRNHVMDGIWEAPEMGEPLSVQVEHNVDQTGIVVNKNNLEGLLHGGGPGGAATGPVVNAEDNWWGDTDPSDDVFGPVDSNPFEISAFPTF